MDNITGDLIIQLILNMLLTIAEKQTTFLGVSSAFDNISIQFGRTQADFQGNMLHWIRNTIMATDASAPNWRAESSVAVMMFRISRIYTGPA